MRDALASPSRPETQDPGQVVASANGEDAHPRPLASEVGLAHLDVGKHPPHRPVPPAYQHPELGHLAEGVQAAGNNMNLFDYYQVTALIFKAF